MDGFINTHAMNLVMGPFVLRGTRPLFSLHADEKGNSFLQVVFLRVIFQVCAKIEKCDTGKGTVWGGGGGGI